MKKTPRTEAEALQLFCDILNKHLPPDLQIQPDKEISVEDEFGNVSATIRHAMKKAEKELTEAGLLFVTDPPPDGNGGGHAKD